MFEVMNISFLFLHKSVWTFELWNQPTKQ